MENIAENIKKLRELRGLSPEQMADKLEMDVRTYRKYESGENSPSIRTLSKIAEIFEMSLLGLIGFNTSQVFNHGRYQGNFSNNKFDDPDKFMEMHHEIVAAKDGHIASLQDVIQSLKDEISMAKEFSKLRN